MLKPIPLCPMEPRPADTWPGSIKDIRDRIDDHVNDRSDPHDTLEKERVKEVVGTGSANVHGRGDGTVVVDVPDRLSGFRNDVGFVTADHVWRQEDVAGLVSALSGIASTLGVKADLVNGRVPASQIPSEFDEVLFYVSGTDFINGRGEFGKLYVDMACNRIYRWDATTFVELSSSDGVAADLAREIASVRKLLEGYAAKDHDHDGRYVPFTVDVLTDEWDVIPPEGHDASEYSVPWIRWGDVFGSGTESWEYSPGTNTPESISFDRDERGPLDVKLEIYHPETGVPELVDGQIVRRVVKARMFEISDGAVVLGDNFPRASGEAYGAVKIGDGLKVVDGVVSSDVPDTISDSAGNAIRADGSSVVMDGSWTCNGVLLTRKEGRDYWENAERHWGLGYDPSAKWAFTNGSGHARLDAPADATKLSFVIGEVTYDATIGRADSVVMAGDVVPKGDGTETVATIGGKDIKAPASPVSSVNGKTGAVKLVAADVGALALESANKVGSSFSMDSEGEETEGGNLSFGVGMGPAGRTFIANKLYCSDRLYANGFVITNTSGAPGESVLNRIQEYGGDYKTALDEVNGLVETAKRYSVVRPEASGNTYQLSDFAVNVVDLPSSGEYTFTFPPRTGGRVRDFVLKLNVTADPLPTVQFVKHPTDSDPPRFEGADGWSELELGVNFFGFTETS